MPTTGVTAITVTQAMREAGSRCGQSSALRMKAICSMTWSATSRKQHATGDLRDRTRTPVVISGKR